MVMALCEYLLLPVFLVRCQEGTTSCTAGNNGISSCHISMLSHNILLYRVVGPLWSLEEKGIVPRNNETLLTSASLFMVLYKNGACTMKISECNPALSMEQPVSFIYLADLKYNFSKVVRVLLDSSAGSILGYLHKVRFSAF
ncbi:hypothetical protein GQ44DRAFT_699330 [Phaeosphaeriaceae sp. PMI808]|nr:hypothetical protein GQ44DRAFT_699330 [Phaeosphaeriaceae sp. PMI808]